MNDKPKYVDATNHMRQSEHAANRAIEIVTVAQPSADYVQTLKPCSTCEGFGFVRGIKCKLCKNGFTQ